MITNLIMGIVIIAAIGISIFLYGRSSRKLGKAVAEKAGFEKATDHAKEALKIDEDVDDMSESDLDNELFGDSGNK